MSSLLQYRPLFSTQVLIDYYLTEESALFQNTADNPMTEVLQKQVDRYNLEQDLLIVPTEETKRLMKNNRLLFRRNNRGFTISCQVSAMGDGSFIPFIDLDTAFSLKFAIHLRNPYFANFTNVRLESDLTRKDQFVYYFSNRANNVVNNETLYLSQAVPDFDDSFAYEASEIFIDRSNPLNPIMREAIENNGPGSFDNTHWRELFADVEPLFQFVTTEDRIVLRPSIFKINVEIVAEERLIILVNNIHGDLIKRAVYQSPEIGTPIVTCEIDLREIDTGFYQLVVQDGLGNLLPELTLTFFKEDALISQRPLGIIECFHEPDNSLNEYRWLDETNGNRLRTPQYTIRWKNRATWWRYYHETAPEFTSTMIENLDPDTAAPNHRILISTDPLALTQLGREVPLNLETGDIQLLPNPDVQMIYPENGRLFSELNMGGGYGPPE